MVIYWHDLILWFMIESDVTVIIHGDIYKNVTIMRRLSS